MTARNAAFPERFRKWMEETANIARNPALSTDDQKAALRAAFRRSDSPVKVGLNPDGTPEIAIDPEFLASAEQTYGADTARKFDSSLREWVRRFARETSHD